MISESAQPFSFLNANDVCGKWCKLDFDLYGIHTKKKKPFCNAFAFQTTGKKKYKKYGKVKTKCINIKEL